MDLAPVGSNPRDPRTAVEHAEGDVNLWDLHSIPRLAAALAFYAVLSLAPFMVLVVGASAMLFGEKIAQQDMIHELQEIVGPEATLLISSLILGARHAPSGVLSSVRAVLLLFFGASGAFVELRSALNYIWGLPEPSGLPGLLKDRLFAFGLTSAMGLILLACLSTDAAMKACQPFFTRRFILPGFAAAISSLLLPCAASHSISTSRTRLSDRATVPRPPSSFFLCGSMWRPRFSIWVASLRGWTRFQRKAD